MKWPRLLLPFVLAVLAACSPPLPTPVPRTPLPLSPRAITPENAKEVQALQCVQAGSAERLAFSPDGRLLAVTSGSGLVLYDAQSLAQLRLFSVPTDEGVPGFSMLSVAFSPDGTLLASGSVEGRVRLWRVSDGSLLPTQSRHSDSVIALAFSADGTTLASASYDSTVRIWRVPDGVLLRTLEGFERKRTHPEAAHCLTRVTFSPDGAVVAWACGRAIGLYRTVDGARLRVLRMPEDVYTVAYSPDGTMLAAGSYERLRIWRLGARASTLLCEQDLGSVGAMAFSPDGQLLARGVTFFSIAESRDASTHPRSGQPGGSIRSVGFSPDGALLATGSEDGLHCFWGLQP